MAKTKQFVSSLSPLQGALLGAKHEAATVSESAHTAYWLDGRSDVACDQHLGWMLDAYDRLTPHIAALRAMQTKKAA